jgi:ketosteroid isomerase-like protein
MPICRASHGKHNKPRDTARAMSEDHAETIRQGIEAFNRADWDAALELVSEDVVWVALLATVDGDKVLFGRDAVRRAWEAQREALGGEAFGIESHRIRDLGAGTLLVRLRLTGRGTTSGVPIEVEYAQLWTLREGLAVRIDNYANEAEALKAAGLTE